MSLEWRDTFCRRCFFFFLWIDTAFFGISFSSQNSSSQIMNSEPFLCFLQTGMAMGLWQVLFKSAVKQQNVLEKVEQQGNLLSEVFSAAVMPSSGSDFFQLGSLGIWISFFESKWFTGKLADSKLWTFSIKFQFSIPKIGEFNGYKTQPFMVSFHPLWGWFQQITFCLPWQSGRDVTCWPMSDTWYVMIHEAYMSDDLMSCLLGDLRLWICAVFCWCSDLRN